MATSPLRLLDTPTTRAPLLDARPLGLSSLDEARLDASGGNVFTNAFRGAGLSNEANSAAAEESSLRAQGDPASLYRADNLRMKALESQQQAQAYAAPVGRYEDIHGLGDAGSWFAGQVGQGLGSSVDMLASGAALGGAATLAGMIPHPLAKTVGYGLRAAAVGVPYVQNVAQNKGEAYRGIQDDPVAMARSAQDIDREVSKHGYIAGAMDTLPQLLPIGQIGGGAVGRFLKKIPTPMKLTGGVLGEGVTETGQQISQHYAHEALNPNRDTSQDFSENMNSFLGGMAGSTGMAGAGHVAEKAWSRLVEPGDGKNGDAIPLNEGAPAAPPARKLESMLGETGSRFKRQSEAKAYAAMLDGTQESVAEDIPAMIAEATARKSALLEELSKRKEPQAEKLAAQLAQVDLSDIHALNDPAAEEAMSGAASWLLPRLHLTPPQIDKLKKNEQRDGSIPSGTGGAFANIDEELLPDGVRAKLGEEKFAAAQNEVKLHKQTTRLVADKLWTAFQSGRGGEVNADDRGEVMNLAQELMATNTIQKPTDGEIRRAQRLGEKLARTLGEGTEDLTNEILRVAGGGSPLLGHAMWAASTEAATGDSLTLGTKLKDRDEAAREMLTLIPPTVERRLLNQHGVDLSQDQDRHDLMQLMEDFNDGHSKVTLIQLNKLLTAPVVKSLLAHVGQPIKPRLSMGEQMARDTKLGADKEDAKLSSDDEGVNDDGTLASGEEMDATGEANDFEAVGHEKSLDKVAPESMVFHHRRDTVTPFNEAWNEYDGEDAQKNKVKRLPELLREGSVGVEGLKGYVKALAEKAAKTLGIDRDRYVIGDPTSSDPLVKAGATSALSMMDKGNVQDSKRAQLFLKYLQQEKHPHADDIAETYKIYSYLNGLSRKASDIVANRKSLSPSGETLSMKQAAELAPVRLDYERLGGVMVPEDLEKLKELFREGGNASHIGVANVLKRAKTAALQAMRDAPGFGEFATKIENEQGRTPEFSEYVNDFFSKRYAVVAEQPTNKDHLQMDHMTFRKMFSKGEKNMRSAWKTVQGLGYSPEQEVGEMKRVVAGMNLIRFKSEHATSKSGEVKIPAYMIVEWAREQRDNHEAVLDNRKDPDPRGEGQGKTRQTEDYRRLLLDGISALMRQGLTDGLPWIVNAQGKREEFSSAMIKGSTQSTMHMNESGKLGSSTASDARYAPVAGVTDEGFENVGYGALPPSLDLNGVTNERFNSGRAFGAERRREEKATGEAWKAGVRHALIGYPRDVFDAGQQQAEEDLEDIKNAELSKDPTDVQANDAAEKAEAETAGSKKSMEERRYQHELSSVMRSAADALPKFLSPKGAINKAQHIAAGLWRDLMTGADGKVKGAEARATESSRIHSQAMARVMSYAMAAKREGYYEDKNAAIGGVHYLYPLAPLLSERNMRNLAVSHPQHTPMLNMLRSKVAGVLLAQHGAQALTTGEMNKLANMMNGSADKAEQERLDKITPPDQSVLDARGKLPVVNRLTAKQVPGYLAGLAKPYQEYTARATERGISPETNIKTHDARLVPPMEGKTYETVMKDLELAKGYVSQARIADGALMLQELEDQRNTLLAKDLAVVGYDVHASPEGLTVSSGLTRNEPGVLRTGAIKALDAKIARVAGALARARARSRGAPALIGAANDHTVSTRGRRLETSRNRIVEGPILAGPLTEAAATGPKLTLRQRAEAAAAAQAGAAGSVTEGRTRRKAPFLEQDAVDADTAEVNGRIDKLNDVLGNTAAAAKAKPMKAQEAQKTDPVKEFDGYVARGYYSQWFKDSVAKIGKAATDLASGVIRTYRISQVPELRGATIAADGSTVENIPESIKAQLHTNTPGKIHRVMVGNHGVYVEFTPREQDKASITFVKERLQYNEHVADGHKLYEQTKGVNYADYQPGRWYVSAEDALHTKAAAPAQGAPKSGLLANPPTAPAEPHPVTTLAMYYRDGQDARHVMRPEFRGKDTMDLILSGDRTATTGTLGRFKGAKKGDVVMATGNGKQALIRFTSDPYPVTNMGAEEWSKLEGWAPSVLKKYRGGGGFQATFELVKAQEAPKTASKTPVLDTLPSHTPGQKTMTYAGIGSRRTPPEVLAKMKAAAKQLEAMGYTLLSGGAQGADSAFESGVAKLKQIFRGSNASDKTRAIAREVHPAPDRLGQVPLNLMARNTNQIFGENLDSPVDFVLAWTPDGAENTAERSIKTGGTGQAIDMASRKGIPVINMAKEGWQQRVRDIVRAKDESAKAEAVNIWHGSNENAELSNLAERPFTYKNRGYISVEHAYQVNKSGFFDRPTHDKYTVAGKKFAGGRSAMTADGWNLQLMKQLVSESFKQNPEAAAKLKATGNAVLTHTQDKGIWAAEFPRILTEVRAELGQGKGEVAQPAQPVQPKATLQDAIAKRQEFLANPPDDYTTAKAAEIKVWAEKQIKRVREAIRAEADPASDRAMDLEDMLSDLKRMVKDVDRIVAADIEMEEIYGPQDDTKHNDQATVAETLVSAPTPTSIEVSSALAHFKRVLGPQVKVVLEKAFPGMTWRADWDAETLTARISTANPLMTMQLAYHESMHAFFTTILKNHPETRAMLEGVMSDPKMLARLKDMLRGSPDAIAAIEKSPEERVAYAYQFWAAGMLDVDTKPETVFHKIQALLRRVFGMVRDSEKAMALFEAFHKGGLKEESAAGVAIRRIMNTGEWRARWAARFDKQVQAAYTEVMTSHDALTSSESKTAREIAAMYYSNPSDAKSAGKPGMINLIQMQGNKYQSRLNAILDKFNGPNQKRDYKALIDRLNGDPAPVSGDVAKGAEMIHKLLDHYYDYARDAGLKMGVRQKGEFFPVIWDLDKMIAQKEAFTGMLLKEYSHILVQAKNLVDNDGKVVTLRDVAEAMHQAIIERDGVDDGKLQVGREDGVLSPYFASENRRNFDWIAPEHRKPFLGEDVVKTTSQYFHQGVRAAEYVRAFGVGGEHLQDMLAAKGGALPSERTKDMGEGESKVYEVDGPIVTELKAEAAKQKLTGKKADEWVARRMDDIKRASGALEGTLGKDIKPGMRKFQSAAMTYQSVLRLPLALFSAMLDPNGIAAVSGEWEDAKQAYIHGLKNVFLTWKDLMTGTPLSTRGDPLDLKNAMTVGVLAPTMFMEEKGDAYTSEYSTGLSRAISRRFFLANGLTVWDRSMRIMATKAAMKSIANNERGASPEHSARWLKELGLTPGSIALDKEGNLIVDRNVLAAHYGADMSVEQQRKDIDAELLKVHLAVNRWVNRAVVSPNSALRPTRASDPHYAMFFQFKSFTYAFQKTTMAYAIHEAKNGNSEAAMQLAYGMPIMIAADVMKAMLTGGGSLPGYMASWTIADWVGHAFNRAGGGGIAQIGMDALSDPVGAIGGPTLGHAKDLLTGDSLGHELFKSVPIVSKFGPLATAAKGMAEMSD